MVNFVLCFDKNYNEVAYLFLHTLIKNVDEKINIFIIHDNPDSFLDNIKMLQAHKNINSILIYEFKNDLSIFPGITHGHISEATYYRFFLDAYLPHELEHVAYVDADIICHKNPIPLIRESINNLKNTNYIISAKTELVRGNKNELHWDRLPLIGNRYFNAGVMIIDFQKWNKNKIPEKLYSTLQKHYDKLIYWDQDVLNLVFDDNYLELNKNLNFDLFISTDQNNLSPEEHFGKNALEEMSLLHYTGSIKPWTVRGSFNKKATYFHDAYYELFENKYTIKNSWKISSLMELLKGIFKLHIRNLRYPFSFIYVVLKSLMKKSN